jgi:NAD(P)-dependent dehydrogenase (short-subunit alcohol dehydrogenase family)
MLNNRVVIITGGAGLIGQEFVRAVVEQNGIAIIADIDGRVSKEVKYDLCAELSTKNIDTIELNITNLDSILNMVSALHARYGRIDALVNNAYPRNKNYGRKFFDVEYSDFCENLNVNLGGYFLTSQQLARYFKKQGYGNIVNIASIYGVIPPKFEVYENTAMTTPVEYAAIKSALIHLTKYMAKYFKGMNIRVNTLSPGGVLDGQNELFLEAYRKISLNKGMLDKSDLRGALIFLLSDLSKYVNGQNIVVDDGYSL